MSSGSKHTVPARCVVTGGSGFVGTRLVEMLLERGAQHVTSFDIVPFPEGSKLLSDPRVKVVVGDIRDKERVMAICEGADCVWHNAAAVGPFHPKKLYEEGAVAWCSHVCLFLTTPTVNYLGTLHVIEGCRKHGVRKIVMSSSPSTRFTGEDVNGLTEAQMPKLPLDHYVQEYAKTKAMGEMALTSACTHQLLTVAVAPHQVYGPRDNLFLPNILEAAGTGRFRILGHGRNKICFTHVDNYCHGLIIAEKALYPGSPALGKFYIVTDMETHTNPGTVLRLGVQSCLTHAPAEGSCFFYDELDKAVTGMGFTSIKSKFSVPKWLLVIIAWFLAWITYFTGVTFKLTPFTVTMMTMNRWFDCSAAVRDLGYKPILSFQTEWPNTIDWFRKNWLPGFEKSSKGVVGLYANTQRKIDIQAGKVVSDAKKTK
jgi:nucleoside-diphosphate-sugar epimerase